MLAGGVIGAIILPPFSDKQHKRRIYLVTGFLLAIPCLVGLTYASNPLFLFTSSFFLGFFLVGVSPIGIQYAAEITHPTPEGTSNGLIQLFGQASVVFVYGMEATKASDGSFTPSLLIATALLILSVLLSTQLPDPKIN
jgi:MFS family permease